MHVGELKTFSVMGTTNKMSAEGKTLPGKIILYGEIPKYTKTANTKLSYQILLTKFQAKLYQRKIEHDLMPLGKTPAFVDTVLFVIRLGVMFLCCRNILLLGYFHEFDRESVKAMEFRDYDGKILLVTNSHVEVNTT